MMKKLFALLLAAFFIGHFHTAGAQDLNIKDDTIRVSSSAYPMLSFMGEIREANPLCADYKLITSTTTITIRPGTSKPVKVCRLIVSEGSKNSPRQHQFVLLFDKDADPADQIHDYSTKDLMEQRIAFLEKMRAGAKAGGATAAKEDEEEKPKHKGRKGRHKDDDEEDKPAPKEDPPVKATVKETPKETPKETGDDQTAQTSHSGGQSAEEVKIEEIPTEQLSNRVKQKINAFYRACENLCTKTDVDATIKYGMKLFNNEEDVIVSTTNAKTNATRPQKIRQYLVHLSQLSYKKVEMTASDIKFVSKFHKNPDGTWHASAVIIQDFMGYKDYNILAFKDRTTKTIDITIVMFEDVKEGKTIQKFDIFLGNISVTNS